MRLLVLVTLLAGCSFASVVRIPGPGGSQVSSSPPPADITVSAFTQAAIVTAISQCTGAAGHQTIFFPQGTYPISSTIQLNANTCTLFGVRAKSILDGQSCGCYIFQGASGNGVNYTFTNLKLLGGGFVYDFTNGTLNINHVVLSNLSTQYGLSSLAGISGLTWDSNIVIGFSCPSPCGSNSPTGVGLATGINNSSFTNSYWQDLYQGFALGGGRTCPFDCGVNTTLDRNTFQGIIRMPIEWTTPSANAVVTNNYASNFRTQTEIRSPNGTNNAVFTGQNPVQGCPNYPNGSNPRGTAPDATGFGNRYDCNSFCISVVGGGANDTINNNYCQGFTNGTVSISWGIEVVVASGQVRNNVMLGPAFGVSDDGQSSDASTTNNSNNIHCGIFNTNPASGTNGNIYNASCMAAGIPAPTPVPNMPFDPVTGN